MGESGCGKSSLGRTLLRLEDPTSGTVTFDGIDLDTLKGVQLKAFRRQAQIIYQDPYSALNPRQRVGDIITEPLAIHGKGTKHEQADRVKWLMEVVGLRPGQARRYPHEFSGGQHQRIVIARTLALQPPSRCPEPNAAASYWKGMCPAPLIHRPAAPFIPDAPWPKRSAKQSGPNSGKWEPTTRRPATSLQPPDYQIPVPRFEPVISPGTTPDRLRICQVS